MKLHANPAESEGFSPFERLHKITRVSKVEIGEQKSEYQRFDANQPASIDSTLDKFVTGLLGIPIVSAGLKNGDRFQLYGGNDPRLLAAYPLDLAARFVLLPISTLRVWVFGATWKEKDGVERSFKPLIIPPDRNETVLSFVNLVEAHVLKTIRRKHRVQMIKVREAIDQLTQMYNTEHPLADVDLLAGGTDLFVNRFGVLLNLSLGKQVALEFLQIYLSRIERNLAHEATRLYPFVVTPKRVGKTEIIVQDSKLISIDPYISYGRPVITGTGIPTDAVADRFWGGDSIEELAEDFECGSSEIEYAIRYEKAQQNAQASL